MNSFGNFPLVFVSIFVALDIVGTLPMFLSMTRSLNRAQRRRIVNTSMIVAFTTALVFAVVGKLVFRMLGITIPDFRIAGGIVLLLISLADLVGQPEAAHRASGSTGIVPLAVPLITGPAMFATLILQIQNAGYPLTLAALILNYVLAWLILRHSGGVTRLIGNDGTVVVSKIMALLLTAIAVSMVRSGLTEVIRTGLS